MFNMNSIKSLAKLDWLTEYESKIARFSHRCTPAAHRSRCLFMDLITTMLSHSHSFAVGVRRLRSNFAKDEAASHSNCAELRRPQHMFSIVLNNTRKITNFSLPSKGTLINCQKANCIIPKIGIIIGNSLVPMLDIQRPLWRLKLRDWKITPSLVLPL